ncbi:hypothetical protein D3C72_1731380 [compost metagenome]
MSAWPASLGFSAPISLPMSAGLAAPVSAMAAWMAATISASPSLVGRYWSITTISSRSITARSSRLAASNWLTESLRCLTIFSSTASTAASSSSMRSSTSLRLMSASIRRITPRRCFSPAFMAAFMSSVSCCFRLMEHLVFGQKSG